MGSPALSLLRFHARASVRLAWRVAIPVFTAPTVALGVSHDPNASLRAFAKGAAGSETGFAVPAFLALVSIAIASWAAPRLTYGATAWLRHLPASEREQRRAAIAGLALAQLPVTFVWLSAWIVVHVTGDGAANGTRLMALVLLPLGVSVYTIPSGAQWRQRAAGRVGGLAAVLAVISGSALLMASSVAALWVADRRMGPLELRSRARVPKSAGRMVGPFGLSLRIVWRALPRNWPLHYLLPGLCLGVLALFIRNNELSAALVSTAARLAGGVALVGFVITLGAAIAARRPSWPWLRSLPISSSRRLVDDASFLSLAATPIVVTLAILSPGAAVLIALTVPYVTLRTTAAMREPRPTTDSLVVAELLLGAGLIAVLPWATLGAVALVPLAHRWAVSREQGAGVRSRHKSESGDGDTQSWTGR